MLLDKQIPFSYILNKIRVELFYVMILGILVFYLTRHFRNLIPEMPIAIPAFLGTGISVILSFKLNQSYERWWEARRIWGSIVNDSRSFIMQLQMFLAIGNPKIRQIAHRQIAWSYCLGQSLRGLNPSENLNGFIDAEEMKIVDEHSNKPLAILQLNTQSIRELKNDGQIDTFSQIQLNNTIVSLTNSMGMAERIKSTVFPTTYRLFLHLLIYLFVVTLSISLRDIESYFEIPLLMIISSAFFLLEKSAEHLQDPFSNKPTDTAMTTIARTIEINIKDLIKEKAVLPPVAQADFYIM